MGRPPPQNARETICGTPNGFVGSIENGWRAAQPTTSYRRFNCAARCYTRAIQTSFLRSLFILLAALPAAWPATADRVPELGAGDALIVLVPHPDDEVLGCGGLIQRANEAGARVKVVFLTVGDANEWSFIFWNKRPVILPRAVLAMGHRRSREALAAAEVLGVDPESVTFLGYPDHGTGKMLLSHWGDDRRSVRGNFTRARSVPYEFAFRRGAPYRGDSVLADLKTILRDFRPTRLCVSHPADHHPDHHALYLYTTLALWDLESSIRPAVYPFLVHYPRWPGARGFSPAEAHVPPALLTAASWIRLPLDPELVATKREALVRHATQYNYSAQRLLPFVRANELFGDFPRIVLRPGGPAGEISDDELSFADAAPADLIEHHEDDEASFVDLEHISLSVDGGGNLVIETRSDKPLSGTSFAVLHLLGWRGDRPFEEMPKLTVRVGSAGLLMTDNGRRVRRSGIRLKQGGKTLELTIPLALLGDPERALFGASTSVKERVLDQVPWRTLEIRPAVAR